MMMTKPNVFVGFARWAGKGMLSMGGFYKGSPFGEYPGKYTSDNIQDAQQQLHNAKELYKNSGQYGEVSAYEAKKQAPFEVLASIAWAIAAYYFSTLGTNPIFGTIVYDVAMYATASFAALTALKAYKLYKLGKQEVSYD